MALTFSGRGLMLLVLTITQEQYLCSEKNYTWMAWALSQHRGRNRLKRYSVVRVGLLRFSHKQSYLPNTRGICSKGGRKWFETSVSRMWLGLCEVQMACGWIGTTRDGCRKRSVPWQSQSYRAANINWEGRMCTIEANNWETKSIVRRLFDSRATCRAYLAH